MVCLQRVNKGFGFSTQRVVSGPQQGPAVQGPGTSSGFMPPDSDIDTQSRAKANFCGL